ncbi:MAG TPA: sulfotransferase [Sulfuriferula sp.]|nr:sulfotransferase [Sulfuriferula sp.]
MGETKRGGPIFIVGCPRSGTTLLQFMLRAHPRISLPTGESHFFIPMYRNRHAYGNLDNVASIENLLTEIYTRSTGFFDEDMPGITFDATALANEFRERGINSVEGIIAAVFEKNALGEGKVRWGDKTPYYALHLPTILEMFPDAQVIHLIRDGRGVAWSLMDRRHDFRVYNAYIAAKYWQQYVEAARNSGCKLGRQIYLEIRYEDLLEAPDKQLQKICEFLGEAYSPALLEYEKPSETTHTLLHKPVQKDNIDKWRRLMTKSQIKIFEAGAGDTLTSFGYELVTSGKPLPKPIRALFRLHNLVASWWYRHRKSWQSK